MAPFEMVLVFPIFLALLCCAMWVAGMMIRKSEVTVIARYKGDAMRYSKDKISSAGSKPFDFSANSEGRVSASHETEFRFSGIMPVGRPSASYLLLLNSWDYRQEEMRMEKSPNYELAFRLAAQGPGKNASARMQGVKRLFDDVKSILDDIFGAMQSSSLTQALGKIPGLVTKLSSSQLAGQYGDSIKAEVKSELTNMLRQKAIEMLAEQIPYVKEIINLYSQISGASSGLMEEARTKARQARERMEQLEESVKLAAKVVENPEVAMKTITDAMNKAGDKPEDRKKALQESSKELLEAVSKANQLLASAPDEKDKKSVDKFVRDTLNSRYPNPESIVDPRLKQAIEIARKEGFSGLSSEIEKTIRELEKAVGDGDKEAEKKLMESLQELTKAASQVMTTAAQKFSGLGKKGAVAEAKANQQLNSVKFKDP